MSVKKSEKLKTNRVILGEASSILSTFPVSCIDLVVTSPPYDNLRDYDQTALEPIIDEIERVMKPGGVVVWVVSDAVIKGSETGSSFKQALYFMGQNFLLHDTMIFEKNTISFPARRTSNRYSQIFEYMFVFSKGEAPKTANLMCDKPNKWAGYTNWGTQTKRKRSGELVEVNDINPVPTHSPRNNIWKYTVSGGFGHKDKRAYEHPATFPLTLAMDHIRTWSEPNDIVLDPMCGSGTTCIAAKMLGRRFIGIDINAEYCELSRRRLSNN